MKRKNTIILLGSLIVIIFFVWYFSSGDDTTGSTIKVEVKSGQFVIDVTTTGELEARNSENIMGPNNQKLRNARIYQLTIEDIVPDGTVVDSGDWVATLDRSELENKIKDQELEVEKLQNQYVKTQLDTSMTLRNARDELVNLDYTLEEKKIVMDQSIYEPPATQRQVKIDYEKTKRTINQSVENYELKYQKAKTEMKEVATNLKKAQRKMNEFIELKKAFTIRAPKAGMLTYKKTYNGNKQGIGEKFSSWENIVATLPNLTKMNSKTYVNEIDISKVNVGQKAEIEVDAFPGKVFTGKVVEVANIGEQLRNSNAKVFEVIIHVDGQDSILRPSMTTKNTIITKIIDNAFYVPIESVHSNDSITYVFKGSRKYQVIPGKSNESNMIILAGLEEGDKVYLQAPAKADEWSMVYLDSEKAEQRQKSEKPGETEIEEGPFNYYLVVGSFSEIKEATDFIVILRKEGYNNAGILRKDKMRRVYINVFSNSDEIEVARQQLPDNYRDAWVYREKIKDPQIEQTEKPAKRKGNRPVRN